MRQKCPDLLVSYTYPKQRLPLADYTSVMDRHLGAAKLYMVFVTGDVSILPGGADVQLLHYKELDILCKP